MKGIIFDLDGVLVFTDKLHYQAWKVIADQKGIYFDEKINDRLRGISRMESLDIILEKYDGPVLIEEKQTLAKEKNMVYRRLLSLMTPDDVDEQARSVLLELRKRGYRLAVGSSSKNADFILEQTGMRDLFDAVSDGNNIARSKPDPEVFIKAAELLGLQSEDCIVVEDAAAGIEAAKRGGMKAAAIHAAAGSEIADYKLHTLSDLLIIL